MLELSINFFHLPCSLLNQKDCSEKDTDFLFAPFSWCFIMRKIRFLIYGFSITHGNPFSSDLGLCGHAAAGVM